MNRPIPYQNIPTPTSNSQPQPHREMTAVEIFNAKADKAYSNGTPLTENQKLAMLRETGLIPSYY